MKPMKAPITLLLLVLACSCDSADADDGASESSTSDVADSSGEPAFDEAAVFARAMAYETELVQINATSLGSLHGLADTVDMWVSPEIAEMYRSLDPDAAGPLVDLPDGALLVKTHKDAGGVVAGYTLMAKGDPSSTSGGWWWARVGANGEPAETGQVPFCVDCHRAVESEGWVYGVPLDNRR